MKRFVITLLVLTIVSVANAADVVIGGISSGRGLHSLVYVSSTIGYAFFIDNPNVNFVYKKTTDSGATWSAAVVINSQANHTAYDVWYDQWTPGDAGNIIHLWYLSNDDDDVHWRSLDTSSDTLGTERTVFNGATGVSGRGVFVSGTKTQSGYLYCAYDIDAGAELGFRRSTDSGTTWSGDLGGSATALVEATIDQCLLFPATGTGDNNDCWAIYQDASADALTMKMYDSSGNSVVESSSMQTMVENTTDNTGQMGFSGSVRKSDGHIIVVSCSEYDTATADMQAWDVSAVNSGSLTGITALTNLTTDKDDNYNPAVYVDSLNNIYVGYNGKRDGSETISATTKAYYTKSTDGGTTWTSGDTAYMEGSAAPVRQVWTPLSGSRFALAWRESTAVQIQTNVVNSVSSAATPNGFFQLLNPGQ